MEEEGKEREKEEKISLTKYPTTIYKFEMERKTLSQLPQDWKSYGGGGGLLALWALLRIGSLWESRGRRGRRKRRRLKLWALPRIESLWKRRERSGKRRKKLALRSIPPPSINLKWKGKLYQNCRRIGSPMGEEEDYLHCGPSLGLGPYGRAGGGGGGGRGGGSNCGPSLGLSPYGRGGKGAGKGGKN
jgi:hypothetical protein